MSGWILVAGCWMFDGDDRDSVQHQESCIERAVNPLSSRSGGKPPPRRSDIGFIVKHLPRAVDPETARHGKHNAPTQGGWPRETPQSHATDDETSACTNGSYGRV